MIIDIIDSLKKIIKPQCELSINSSKANNSSIIIKENQLQQGLEKVEITGFTEFIDYLISILENFYLENYQITRNYIYLLFHTQTKQNSKARNVTQPVILEGVKTQKNPKSGFELDVYGIYREISPFEAQQGAKIKVNINAILDS